MKVISKITFIFSLMIFMNTLCAHSRQITFSKWACVQTRPSFFHLMTSKAEMIAVDPDEFTRGEVKLLQRRGKKIFAYLSVGEAEDYRSYYREYDLKPLIVKENPNWKGNFPIKYWLPGWQTIITDYSTKILDKGFDGLYLDIVDAWEPYEKNQDLYKQRMIDFLVLNAQLWRKQKNNLLLIFQNSHELFENSEIIEEYDGIVQEGLFASWMKAPPSDEWLAIKIVALRKIKSFNKFVGLLEYTRDPKQMKLIREAVNKSGFCAYFSEKDLNKLFEP